MSNPLALFYQIHVDATKAIKEAKDAITPPYNPELGLSEDEFNNMVSDILDSSAKSYEDYSTVLKKYEIDQ